MAKKKGNGQQRERNANKVKEPESQNNQETVEAGKTDDNLPNVEDNTVEELEGTEAIGNDPIDTDNDATNTYSDPEDETGVEIQEVSTVEVSGTADDDASASQDEEGNAPESKEDGIEVLKEVKEPTDKLPESKEDISDMAQYLDTYKGTLIDGGVQVQVNHFNVVTTTLNKCTDAAEALEIVKTIVNFYNDNNEGVTSRDNLHKHVYAWPKGSDTLSKFNAMQILFSRLAGNVVINVDVTSMLEEIGFEEPVKAAIQHFIDA